MKLRPNAPCGTLILAGLIWLGGLPLVWRACPVRPVKHRWQPPAGTVSLGFLTDGQTLVTTRFDDDESLLRGPIELWDVVAERCVGSHGSSSQLFPVAGVGKYHDRLLVAEKPTAQARRAIPFQILDARSGRVIFQARKEFTIKHQLHVGDFDGRFVTYLQADDRDAPTLLHDLERGSDVPFPDPFSDLAAISDNGEYLVFSRYEEEREAPWVYTVHASADSRRVGCYRCNGSHKVVTGPNSETMWSRIPTAVSRDGRTVVDYSGCAWDTATGRPWFQLARNSRQGLIGLSPDARWVLVEQQDALDDSVGWISWFDLENGREDEGRRLDLGQSFASEPYNRPWNGEPYCSLGWARIERSALEKWLGKFVGSKRLGQDFVTSRTVVFDGNTGAVTARVPGLVLDISTQSLALVRDCDPDDKATFHDFSIWQLPSRRQPGDVAALAIAWLLPVAWLTWLRLRRFASPAPESAP